jgi:hypothetical protein
MQSQDSRSTSQKEFYWLGVRDQAELFGSLRKLLAKSKIPRAQIDQLIADVAATLDDLQSLKRPVRKRMKPIKGTLLSNMYELRWDFAGPQNVRHGIRMYFVEEGRWIIGLRWQVKPLLIPAHVIRQLQNIELGLAENIYLQYRRKEIE